MLDIYLYLTNNKKHKVSLNTNYQVILKHKTVHLVSFISTTLLLLSVSPIFFVLNL